MKILGIETSCDETAAAVVEMADDGSLRLLSNVVASSMDLHAAYGGVVPEIAARSHIEHMMPVVEKALTDAFSTVVRDQLSGISSDSRNTDDEKQTPQFDPWEQIDAIAVTQGPGLGGSLLVGVTTARTLATRYHKPLHAVQHVMAHPFATFISSAPEGYQLPDKVPSFPMLALIVSGGHSQLVLFRSTFDYTVLGRTKDDAVGEAFDKVAKVLGLPYPGGPSVGKKALDGDARAFTFPKSKIESEPYSFSFSGLKTAVLRATQHEIGEDHTFPSSRLAERLSEAQKANIAASFQHCAIETLVDRTFLAYEEFTPDSVVVAGGVAASPELRRQLAERLPIAPIYTDMRLCTDNGAMIAALGCYMHRDGLPPADPYSLDIKPSWPM